MTEVLTAKNDKNDGHANQSFRFVQLSDLHLSSPGIPNPFRLFNKRILGYLSWLRKRRLIHQRWILDCALDEILQLNIDHQVITGDILHIGLKNEFEQSAKWLAQFNPKDVTIIPGNHDLYVKEKWSRSFKYWEDFLIGDEDPHFENTNTDDALEKLNQLYPTVRIRNKVAFISISSVFESPWFCATGFVSANQIKSLSNILNNPALEDYCKVLLVHHPITLTNTKPRKCLINHRELTNLLSSSPVDLVLHGHEHKTSIEYIDTKNNYKIPVVGITSSSSNSQLKNYQAEFVLYEICNRNLIWEIQMHNFTFDVHKRKFQQTHSKLL